MKPIEWLPFESLLLDTTQEDIGYHHEDIQLRLDSLTRYGFAEPLRVYKLTPSPTPLQSYEVNREDVWTALACGKLLAAVGEHPDLLKGPLRELYARGVPCRVFDESDRYLV